MMMCRCSKKILIFGAILLFAIVVVLLGARHQKHNRESNVISVTVAKVVTQPMPVELKMPGQIEPIQSVNITPQVTGVIQKIDFNAGQLVNTGQLLFEIDPALFVSKLNQAKDALLKDQAQLNNLLKNQKRLQPLAQKGYVSKQDYDQLVSQINMQLASVKSDQEQVREAQIQLDYARVKSPISGKSGQVILKVGDLVQADSTTPLVSINQLNYVFANFNLPQNELPRLLAYHKQGSVMTVDVFAETGNKLLGTGNLTFIDNAVNAETGTVLLKATIPNQNHLLWPSQMVLVKLTLATEENAIIIPSQAVKIDDAGAFVYRVDRDKARVQRIQIDRNMGQFVVVKNGLKPGDIVVTLAPPNLTNGSVIKIISSNETNSVSSSKASS